MPVFMFSYCQAQPQSWRAELLAYAAKTKETTTFLLVRPFTHLPSKVEVNQQIGMLVPGWVTNTDYVGY